MGLMAGAGWVGVVAPLPWTTLWWWRGVCGVWWVGDRRYLNGHPLAPLHVEVWGPSPLAQAIVRGGVELSCPLRPKCFQGFPPMFFFPQALVKISLGFPPRGYGVQWWIAVYNPAQGA